MKASPGAAAPIVNALTVDVEDYFQVSALAPHIPRSTWDERPCRVQANVEQLLQLFEEQQAKATFFTLGWIAQRYPALVREIAARGHEVASHGYGHLRATEQSPEQFRDDVRQARRLLEDLAGQPVRGYRAPSFSIDASNPWAFEILAEEGYTYSSSVYPVKHDHYGMPAAPRFRFSARPGLTEIPITTTMVFGRNLPAGGGGYFRLLPYSVSRWAVRRVNEQDRMPAIFYFHPWEIDPGQPRIAGAGLKTRFRHYVNLERMLPKLQHLLADFRWGRMDDVFELRGA